jgi:UDP-N-acetylmuramyl pentapeptide phosphotransferase/UDP-N-acetylglucosamine-1-phosphate transferase
MVAASTAAGVTALTAWPVLLLLRHSHVIDSPGSRSSHLVPTPRGGGIAVMLGVCVATVGFSHSAVVGMVVGAAAILGLIGLFEDLRGVSQLIRAIAQTVVIAAASSGLLHGHVKTVPLAVAVTAATLASVAYTNAFNFMDGINGISCIQTILAGAVYLGLGAHVHDRALQITAATAVGAAVGFLPWNAPAARMFLGDVGSYGLGGLLALLAVRALADGITPLAVIGPLVLYFADTGVTLARRILHREPWYLPHRTHVYQRLTEHPLTHVQVDVIVGVVIAVCGVLSSLSLGSSHWLQALLAVLVVLVTATYLALPHLMDGARRAGRPQTI